MTTRVLIKRLPHAEGLPLPSYQTAGAAGADLVAAVDGPVVIGPGGRAMIPTGLQIALPEGFEAQVRPRSGLAAKHGITVLNSPGTVDSDYRGEVKVMLVNTNSASSPMSGRATSFTIERGDRIAQMVIAPVTQASFEETEDELPETLRGAGGFGSTGV